MIVMKSIYIYTSTKCWSGIPFIANLGMLWLVRQSFYFFFSFCGSKSCEQDESWPWPHWGLLAVHMMICSSDICFDWNYLEILCCCSIRIKNGRWLGYNDDPHWLRYCILILCHYSTISVILIIFIFWDSWTLFLFLFFGVIFAVCVSVNEMQEFYQCIRRTHFFKSMIGRLIKVWLIVLVAVRSVTKSASGCPWQNFKNSN